MRSTPCIALLACLLLPVATHGQVGAAGPSTAEAAAPPAGDASNPDAGSAATDPAATPAREAPGLPGERLERVAAGGSEFGVRVLPITGGPAQGALVLVPGDGRYPATSRALTNLQEGMPAFGWSTWMPELESPPSTHAAGLDQTVAGPEELARGGALPPGAEGKPVQEPGTNEVAPQGTAAQTGEKPTQEPGAGEAGEEAGAGNGGSAGEASGNALPLEAARAQELQEWAARSRTRLAAVLAAASGEGRVVVVAEGVAAALLTGLVADAPSAAWAVALVDPVELPGLPADWPRGSATPVLEVLDPAATQGMARARRARANATGLHYYRQIVVPLGAGTAPGEEAQLVRRLRGWLRSLETPAAR